MTNAGQFIQPQERILSVDFFRGLTMFLLIGESTMLYEHLQEFGGTGVVHFFATQLSHHEWNGLRF
jgi:predicted acyltransferase